MRDLCIAGLAVRSAAQVNEDSLRKVLSRTPAPLERLKVLKALSGADDLTDRMTHGRAVVHLADSLTANGHADDPIVLGSKAMGLYNEAIAMYRYGNGDTDSTLALYRAAAALFHLIDDRKWYANAISSTGRVLTSAGRARESLAPLTEALAIQEALHDSVGLSRSHTDLGMAYYNVGEFARALEHDMQAVEIGSRMHHMDDVGATLINIGIIYNDQGMQDSALANYRRALAAAKEGRYPMACSIALSNMAGILTDRGQYAEALACCAEGLTYVDPESEAWQAALHFVVMGKVHRLQGDPAKAIEYDERAIELAEKGGDAESMVTALNDLCKVYFTQGRYDKALAQAARAREVCAATTVPLAGRRDLAQLLSDIHSKIGPPEKALAYYKEYVLLRDSLESGEVAKRLQRMDLRKQELTDSLQTEEEKHNMAMTHERAMSAEQGQKRLFLFAGLGVMLIAGGLWGRLRYMRRSRAAIQKEKDRSDTLLLNILPSEVAQELKDKGEAAARDIDNVSILFTDFKDFTRSSEQLTAQELVAEINTCFKAFDEIIGRHGVEKIKTIGDAYMAAGGLPLPSPDSALHTVLAAVEMQAFMVRYTAGRKAQGKPAFEMRVGIHTGPVVAGIVGVKKFQYDIWGDTVNIASRMESSGEVGLVNISGSTYALVKDAPVLSFTPRGRVQAKGKGEMEMYFVADA